MAKQTFKSNLWICLVIILAGSLFLASCGEPAPQPVNVSFAVTFQDHDGTVLDAQTVVAGQAAAAPTDPSRDGFTFVGWDKDFARITEDMTVTALYVEAVDPTVMVVSKTAAAGQEVRVPIMVLNNPGVAGAKITISYDPAMTLKGAENGEAFSVLDYTQPGKYMSPCSFTWDSEKGMAKDNGDILWLIFETPSNAPEGKAYIVNCICKQGDMFDEDLVDVSFDVINGAVTVE